jgi:hypothetical protein
VGFKSTKTYGTTTLTKKIKVIKWSIILW